MSSSGQLDHDTRSGGRWGVPALTLSREQFTRPERVSRTWTLMKGTRIAQCEVWTHVEGFEVRLAVGGQQALTTICRFQDQIARVQQEWRAVLEARAWST